MDAGGTVDASTVIDVPNPDRPDNATRDSDCDGLSDADEFGNVYPSGNRTDPSRSDTDGDGIPDGVEAGRTVSVDARCAGLFQPDGEPTSATDPTRVDTDGDGLNDGAEDANRDGTYARGVETDPRNPDSDGDGRCDGPNDVMGVCTGGDPTPISGGMDADGDGIPDPLDGAPNNPDRDGDGLCDGPAGIMGVCSAGEDTDADGFVDATETDPASKDSDCDGLLDGDDQGSQRGERTNGTNPVNPDSDGDGLLDGLELGLTMAVDVSCPAFAPDLDPGTTTNPTRADTDNDGIPDGAEDANHNGRVDMGELDPNNGTDGTGEVTTREACALDRLVQVQRHFVGPADLQLITAVRGMDAFSQTSILTVPGTGGARDQVGLVGFNPVSGVAFAVFTRPPQGATVAAQETAGRTRLDGVGNLSTPITYQLNTWDGYDAMHGSYAMAGNVGVKARINAIAAAFLTGVDGQLDLTGDITAQGGFLVEAEFIRRSANTAVTMVALLPANRAMGPGQFTVRDLADGSTIGQYGDAMGMQCDRFLTSGYASVDILWSVDNSASMSDEQDAVAASAAAMEAKLNGATVDWRTAVVTSAFYNPRTPASCPNTACGEGGQQCRAWTRDLAQFSRWLREGQTGWIGAGGTCNQPREEVIYSAQLLLSPSAGGVASFVPVAAQENPNKLREDVNLVIIFVGDADDQHYENAQLPMGVDAYETFFRALPVRSLTMGAIACPGGQCGETQRTPHVITTLVNRFGGVQGRLDTLASIGPTVDAILDAVIGNVSPYRLTQPAVSSTIKVAMDQGSTVGQCNTSDVPRSRENGFDYDARSRTLSFFGNCRPDPDQPNKRVAVSYRTWVDLTPNPDPVPQPCAACASCSGLNICNLERCACECNQTLSCNVGFRWDANACDCVCDTASLNCGPARQADATLCACTCRENCGTACVPGEICQQSLCECIGPGG
ncbi:MAG: hypothetical protein IPI55_16595 [Flavobacteriales bacterium]|nr:hypothetical protein [Flavobacteriales bacterium]